MVRLPLVFIVDVLCHVFGAPCDFIIDVLMCDLCICDLEMSFCSFLIVYTLCLLFVGDLVQRI